MATTYLTRTLGTPTDNNKWTFSCWFKYTRYSGTYPNSEAPFFHADAGSTTSWSFIGLDEANQLILQNRISSANVGYIISNAKLQDAGAWYNVVAVFDSSNSTSADRQILYLNGERITSFAGETQAPLDTASNINSAIEHRIGRGHGHYGSKYFGGSMTHVNFIDGTAYPATAFGSVDSASGIWTINTAPSVTYGNNGFSILKDGISLTDSSPNSNNFSLGGGTLTKTEDCPDNNFSTFNPLRPNGISQTYSNGNNTVIRTGTGGQMNGTQGVTSGKWYYECLIDDYWQYLGWTALSLNTSQTAACSASGSGFYGLYSNASGVLTYANGSGTSQGSYTPMASSQIWGIAFDADNAKMYFSVNGVWENSSDPANQTNPAMSSIPVTDFLVPAIGQGTGSRSSTIKMNFGNGYFGTTAVTTNSGNGYAGAEGKSIFNYQPPTGYSALSTKGLNL